MQLRLDVVSEKPEGLLRNRRWKAFSGLQIADGATPPHPTKKSEFSYICVLKFLMARRHGAGDLRNMKNRSVFAVFGQCVLFFALTAAFSCGPVTVTPAVDKQQTATNDGVISILTDELDDMVLIALNTSPGSGTANNGRIDVVTDDRLTCASIVFSNVDPVDRGFGTMTITFPPTGCVDGIKGNVRKGTITVNWTGGRWYRAGSTHTITLTNYVANDIAITGSRTLTVSSYTYTSSTYYTVIWDIVGDHKLTWPDGSSATLSVTNTKQWDHGTGQETYTYFNPPTAVGSYAAQGVNRHGKDFNVAIISPLVYYYSCVRVSKNYMPVVGAKTLTNVTDNVSMTINYGTTYTCDNAFTLIIGSGSIALHAKNNSSDD
jgi:hypothetical protein